VLAIGRELAIPELTTARRVRVQKTKAVFVKTKPLKVLQNEVNGFVGQVHIDRAFVFLARQQFAVWILRVDLAKMGFQSVANSQKIVRILDQWDGAGLPETRS